MRSRHQVTMSSPLDQTSGVNSEVRTRICPFNSSGAMTSYVVRALEPGDRFSTASLKKDEPFAFGVRLRHIQNQAIRSSVTFDVLMALFRGTRQYEHSEVTACPLTLVAAYSMRLSTTPATEAFELRLDGCRGRNSARIDPSGRLGERRSRFGQVEDVAILVEQRGCCVPATSIGFWEAVEIQNFVVGPPPQ